MLPSQHSPAVTISRLTSMLEDALARNASLERDLASVGSDLLNTRTAFEGLRVRHQATCKERDEATTQWEECLATLARLEKRANSARRTAKTKLKRRA